ncbi:MAG: leucine-rich repeat domain-containing protein [Candidatus Margulisbacteria bacterium]|nr:leucine-rich repeat domain-containing protein [Candidatus Margulisiibacteriota bacterium]
MDIKITYETLVKKITPDFLAAETAGIIKAYKEKDYQFFNRQAKKLGIEPKKTNLSKIFTNLVQLYHPDKLNGIIKEIKKLYNEKNHLKLKNFAELYIVTSDNISRTSAIDFEYDEEYGLDDDDFLKFGISVVDQEEIFSDPDDDIQNHPGQSFTDAVNTEFCRNLGYAWNIVDLQRLEGELELQFQNINDLSGIENCSNISSLNLTHNLLVDVNILSELKQLEILYLAENLIEDISFLRKLTNLRELDISFNNIREINILLILKKLEYVNLIGNPINDPHIINKLHGKGITVIY